MKSMNVMNLGILAHVDAGKTTLTEGMLFQAGCIRKMGNVDDGTTVTDSMDLEKERGMTIKSSVISFQWNNLKINLIDTPGHFDFLSEVESVLHVLDVVVLVIAAREGVQPQTRLFFRKLSQLNIPTVIFINKLDRMGVNYEDLIKTIREKLTDEILECQRYRGAGGKQVEIEDIPLDDEELQMKILLSSETMIKKYDESREITIKDYETEFIRLIRSGKLYPVKDPQLKFEISPVTDDIMLSLFGPLQMEIIGEILKNRFGLKVSFGPLTDICKEHPVKEGYCSIRIGDWNNPYNAGVVFKVEPLPLGSGFQYENRVSYGYLEKPFQNAVMDGVRIALNKGVQGHEVIDVKISFLEADYDSVMGTPADFRRLVPIALKKALDDAAVEILEPWQNFIITLNP